MNNGQKHAWSVSKERLIREIQSTYEAICKFKNISPKSGSELESLSLEQLYNELQNRTTELETLVNDWDIKK